MARYRNYLIVIALVLVFFLIVSDLRALFFPSIPKMFKMNKQLQEEGYYMAEFEFKMLGIVYNLDRGKYFKAYSQLTRLNKQLKTREGLIKLPDFKSKEEEMEFYLNLQNPKTGAFMDDSYPFCTYTGPTGNVLNHLDLLAQETGKPIKLKYPLSYLDQINTPETLYKYLDDVSTVGWIGLKFPQTSFHFSRCLLSLFHEDSVVTNYKLYTVSPEWNHALLQWFYDHQDPETGLWGPKSKKGKLLKKDTMNTASIMKAFIDENGNNYYKEFPLRYRDELAQSTLDEIDTIPNDDDLDEWHEWNLKTSKSIRTLQRYLWSGLSEKMKQKTNELILNYLKIKYDKFYISKEGAFSYYPGSEHATLDGSSGVLSTYKDCGAFSAEKQIALYGLPEKNCLDMGTISLKEMDETEFKSRDNFLHVNSIRIYTKYPISGDFTKDVLGVFYPNDTSCLDVMELIPNMKIWIDTTTQSMGNWTSKEDLASSIAETKVNFVPIYKNQFPQIELNNYLYKNKQITFIGFDELQIPRCKITYELKM